MQIVPSYDQGMNLKFNFNFAWGLVISYNIIWLVLIISNMRHTNSLLKHF